MKINLTTKSVTASSRSDSGLAEAIKDIMTEDLCMEVVSLAFSEDGSFSDDYFDEADVFFDIIANEDPREIALMFFNGKDLDSNGPANPNRDYFRRDAKDNVESTDDPAAIYFDELLDDVVDYIVKYYDEVELPAKIQEVIDDFNKE